MSRVLGYAVTGADLKYMVDFDGWVAKNYAALTGLQCFNKLDIELYMEAYVPDTFLDNQLPTYGNFFKPAYTVPENSVFVANTAGSTAVTFYPTDSGAWTAVESASWFSLSVYSGSGATAVTVNYVANTTTSARNSIITFTDTNSGQDRLFLVQQAAAVGEDTDSVSVSGGGVSHADACSRYPSFATTLYIPIGETWTGSTPTNLYSNSIGTIQAPSGYYSDGTLSRYWTGSSFSGFQSC